MRVLDLSNIIQRNKGKQCLCSSKYYYCYGITNVVVKGGVKKSDKTKRLKQ